MLYLNSLVNSYELIFMIASVVKQIVQVIASSEFFFSDLLLWTHPHMVHAKDMWIARSFYLEIFYYKRCTNPNNYIYGFQPCDQGWSVSGSWPGLGSKPDSGLWTELSISMKAQTWPKIKPNGSSLARTSR